MSMPENKSLSSPRETLLIGLAPSPLPDRQLELSDRPMLSRQFMPPGSQLSRSSRKRCILMQFVAQVENSAGDYGAGVRMSNWMGLRNTWYRSFRRANRRDGVVQLNIDGFY